MLFIVVNFLFSLFSKKIVFHKSSTPSNIILFLKVYIIFCINKHLFSLIVFDLCIELHTNPPVCVDTLQLTRHKYFQAK